MDYQFIEVDQDAHITTITINRPKVLNALHPMASLEMEKALDAFVNDPQAWVAIITGTGDRAFCAGNDLKWQAERGTGDFMKEFRKVKYGFGGLTHRFNCHKPIIAAVNGLAMRGGFEIALACDIIVAADSAVFGLPEPRVGLMAAAGGVHRLPRHIPYHLAMDIMLTGRHVPAAEAQQLGVVNQIVPRSELMAAAKGWANQILECSPVSVRASKEAAERGASMSLEQALHSSFPGAMHLFQSEDFIEGPKAFAEKRKPVWKGE